MAFSPSYPLTVLSTFTGAGGLDLGLEKAGFQTIACVELNEQARATIVENRPEWGLLEECDILDVAARLTPEDLGLKQRDLCVLSGGPPCQPFSAAAQWAERGRAGLQDDRALTLLAFFDLAERFLPQVILIENVPGFVLGAGSAVPIIEDLLAQINTRHRTTYRLEHRILQASEYGVPQRRRRAILVARRDGQSFAWPIATTKDAPVRAYDAIGGLRPRGARRASGHWADLLPSIPAGQNYQYHTTKGEGLRLFGHRSWFWSFLLKLSPAEPAWTIPASPGPATGPFHWENRPLTPLELARLQSFPSDWHFAGSDRQQQKQIGNATPPLLAEVIGRALATDVFQATVPRSVALAIPRRPRVPKPPAPEPVPAKYLSRVGAQPDHPGPGEGPGARRQVLRKLGELLERQYRRMHDDEVIDLLTASDRESLVAV
jgi:DNA (cytosine-5)-methyltransferase 1